MRIAVNGIGAAGGFGSGLSALENALKTGVTEPSTVGIDTVQGTFDVPALQVDLKRLNDFASPREQRRMERFTRLALLGCCLALEDAGELGKNCPKTGIIVATGYGATCNTLYFEEFSRNRETLHFSPTKFSNSVHNAAAAIIAAFLKERGPNLSINHFDMSVPSAILTACQWISEGRVAQVLVGGVDEFSKVMAVHRDILGDILTGQLSMDGKSPEPVLPVIGEGSLFLLLSATETANTRAWITDAFMGRKAAHFPDLSRYSAIFAGADGFGAGEAGYAEKIGAQTPVAAYAPLYGAMPVGMGFDIAIACLGKSADTLYPAPLPRVPAISGLNLMEKRISPSAGPVGCLKIGDSGEYGLVSIDV